MKLKNTYNAYPLWKLFPLVVFILNPKIDIISIPGYWQGIRLDDLIILFYSILFFISNNGRIYPNLIEKNKFGYYWILFFPYIVFSMVLGKIYGADPQFMIVIRYLEYIALIIILNQLDPPKNKILLLFKIYILLNFLFVMLQYFEIIGGLTSRGRVCGNVYVSDCFDKDDIKTICFLNCGLGFMKNYIHAGDFIDRRVVGITGGPWELAMNLSISIFALSYFEKNFKRNLPFIILTIIILLITQSRGIIFGFIAGSIFLIKDYKKAFKLFSLIFILILFIYLIDLFNYQEIINNRFLIDYFALIKIIFGAFTGNLPSENSIMGTGLESMFHRASSWQSSISELKKSNLLIFFGSGGGLIYTESFLIRILTSFGLIGCLLIGYFVRQLPFFFIIFIIVTGLTIDMFVSFKIFIFSCLLLFAYKKNKEKINY